MLSGRGRSLQRADHSSRGVLPSVVCLSIIEKPRRGGLGPPGLSSHEKNEYIEVRTFIRHVSCVSQA